MRAPVSVEAAAAASSPYAPSGCWPSRGGQTQRSQGQADAAARQARVSGEISARRAQGHCCGAVLRLWTGTHRVWCRPTCVAADFKMTTLGTRAGQPSGHAVTCTAAGLRLLSWRWRGSPAGAGTGWSRHAIIHRGHRQRRRWAGPGQTSTGRAATTTTTGKLTTTTTTTAADLRTAQQTDARPTATPCDTAPVPGSRPRPHTRPARCSASLRL